MSFISPKNLYISESESLVKNSNDFSGTQQDFEYLIQQVLLMVFLTHMAPSKAIFTPGLSCCPHVSFHITVINTTLSAVYCWNYDSGGDGVLLKYLSLWIHQQNFTSSCLSAERCEWKCNLLWDEQLWGMHYAVNCATGSMQRCKQLDLNSRLISYQLLELTAVLSH